MCGRYQLTLSSETLQQFLPGFELSAHQPRYNIAPTQHAPILRLESGKRVYRQLRFGLIPAWAPEAPVPPLINARSESVFEKPSFRKRDTTSTVFGAGNRLLRMGRSKWSEAALFGETR